MFVFKTIANHSPLLYCRIVLISGFNYNDAAKIIKILNKSYTI